MHLSEKIIGSRIYLIRPDVSASLAARLFARIQESRSSFALWFDWVVSTLTPADALHFLIKADAGWRDGAKFVYLIMHATSHELMGIVSARNVCEQHRQAEITFWLSASFAGKGYMQESIRLLEEKLFDLGFNRLIMHTDSRNEKASQTAHALGYQLEGVLRQKHLGSTRATVRNINVFFKSKPIH